MSRFIKFIPSEEAEFLQENHPNAFLLLIQIAKNARRTANGLDGLKIGDAIVGEIETSKKSGLSKKKYRNALETLEELGYIETVFNPKNENIQKRAIKRAIKSKVVNLKNSGIFDINPEQKGEQEGDLRANKGRSEGDKQERTRKNKNEKEQQQQEVAAAASFSIEEEIPRNEFTKTIQPEKIVSIYDCLKENQELDGDEKEILQTYREERVKLALEYSKHVRPKTTLIQMLRWHCSEPKPPNLPKQNPESNYNSQQKIAKNFNDFMKQVGREDIYEKNKTLIDEGQMVITPMGTISLNNSIEILRKDFDEVRQAYRSKRLG